MVRSTGWVAYSVAVFSALRENGALAARAFPLFLGPRLAGPADSNVAVQTKALRLQLLSQPIGGSAGLFKFKIILAVIAAAMSVRLGKLVDGFPLCWRNSSSGSEGGRDKGEQQANGDEGFHREHLFVSGST